MSNPSLCQIKIRVYVLDTPVPDTDLELKGVLVIQTPQIRGGGSPVFKKVFVWSKNKAGGRAPRAPSLDPPLHPSRPPWSGYACP